LQALTHSAAFAYLSTNQVVHKKVCLCSAYWWG
jgi:hypothetical protein